MAKGTKANGDTYTEAELNDPEPPVRIRRAELGRVDQPCPTDGTDSSASSQTPKQSKPSTESKNPLPVPNAESHYNSKKTSDTAHSTDGNIQETVTESPKEVKQPPRARRTSTKSTRPRSTQARASAIGADDFE